MPTGKLVGQQFYRSCVETRRKYTQHRYTYYFFTYRGRDFSVCMHSLDYNIVKPTYMYMAYNIIQ